MLLQLTGKMLPFPPHRIGRAWTPENVSYYLPPTDYGSWKFSATTPPPTVGIHSGKNRFAPPPPQWMLAREGG